MYARRPSAENECYVPGFQKNNVVNCGDKMIGPLRRSDHTHTHRHTIKDLIPPKNLKEGRRFLCLVSWYRRFIKDVVHIAAPLHRPLKKRVKWEWTDEHQTAFDRLKESLTTAPVLVCPDWSKPFTLQTDASQERLGAALSQPGEQGEQIVAYASRSLTKAERNYSTTELEYLAVKWGIWKMRDYLEGYHFTILKDHLSLKWLG